MPFVSKAQQRKCYAMKSRGQNGSWDCGEWSEHTDYKKLPKRKKSAGEVLGILESAVLSSPALLGRLAAIRSSRKT